MNCELIFYAARKTAFCERSLRKSFSELDLMLTNTSFATDSVKLGELVSDSLNKTGLVFVVGGLGIGGRNSSESIFARVLSEADLSESKKLKNPAGNDGYLFAAGGQIIVLLPDEPEQIELIMSGPLCGYLKIRKSKG